jgi:hypothetical protein
MFRGFMTTDYAASNRAASTGLTQAEAAALFQVVRWIEGTRPTPKVAIERLRTWAYALDQTAQAIIMRLGVPAVLPLYRQDRDVPQWTGLRTAGCHLAVVRRVFERRPDIQLITFDRATYRYWLGNAAVFIEFLKRMITGAKRPIFLIVDRGPAHIAKKTRTFVESLKGRLRLFYLPPYSPDRNPDELVWKHLKADTIGRMAITDKADFKVKVRASMRQLQNDPEKIRAFYQKPSLKYAA